MCPQNESASQLVADGNGNCPVDPDDLRRLARQLRANSRERLAIELRQIDFARTGAVPDISRPRSSRFRSKLLVPSAEVGDYFLVNL